MDRQFKVKFSVSVREILNTQEGFSHRENNRTLEKASILTSLKFLKSRQVPN